MSPGGPPSKLMVAITGMIVFIPIVGLSLLWLRSRTRRRRRTDFVKELQARPGTSPETAYRMSSEQQIEVFLAQFRLETLPVWADALPLLIRDDNLHNFADAVEPLKRSRGAAQRTAA